MNISLASLRKGLAHIIGRFHVTIFVVTVLGGLAGIILLLHNVILTSSDSSGYTPTGVSSEFDQATIDRIEQLKSSTEADGQLDLSRGRTNPFVE